MKNKKVIPIAILTSLFLLASCVNQQTEAEKGKYGLLSLESGFKIANIGEDKKVHVANSLTEASKCISLATLNHYAKVSIVFAFENQTISSDFIRYYLEIDSHVTVIAQNYVIGSNHTNVFTISYRYQDAASHHTKQLAAKSYYPLKNVTQTIRLKNMNKRAPDFNSFALYENNNGSLPVSNSEELWWCVNNNYVPTFVKEDSRAEMIYELAKDVLRQYVNDDMSDVEKLKAIYEWLVCQNAYDYSALDDHEVRWENNVCYYLEGLFEYGVAVCDAYSKAFALLSGLEGIDVVREYGYDKVQGGHAWNYASLDGENYYLICPTWGHNNRTIDGVNYSFCDYKPFLTKSTYFNDNSTLDLLTMINPELSKSNDIYPSSIYELEKIGSTTYDYVLDSQEELNYIIEAAKNAGLENKFCIQLVEGDLKPSVSLMEKALAKANIKTKGVKLFVDSTYYQTFSFVIR